MGQQGEGGEGGGGWTWRDDIVGQQGAVWTRTAKGRGRWGGGGGVALAEGYFLQWKDIA